MRSQDFPLGLPYIKFWNDKEKVRIGNKLADDMCKSIKELHALDRGWIVENPRNSWL